MLFQDKDVICFLGDSMTAGGYWMAEVYQTLKKTVNVKCYNCGVSGSTAYRAEGYLYSRCLSYNPDWVIIMFGINDIDIVAYAPDYTEADKQTRIESAMARYKAAYEHLVQKILAFGSRVIIAIPIPYDEISVNTTPNRMCQCGLDEATSFARDIAERYQCPVVDFDQLFRPRYPDPQILREDRVHPTEYGYHLMAQAFLQQTGVIPAGDFTPEFVWKDWNRKRFDAEHVLHYLNFMQYCLFYDPQNPFADWQDLRRKAAELLAAETDPNSFFAQCYRDYLEKFPHRDAYQNEIIKYTI